MSVIGSIRKIVNEMEMRPKLKLVPSSDERRGIEKKSTSANSQMNSSACVTYFPSVFEFNQQIHFRPPFFLSQKDTKFNLKIQDDDDDALSITRFHFLSSYHLNFLCQPTAESTCCSIDTKLK